MQKLKNNVKIVGKYNITFFDAYDKKYRIKESRQKNSIKMISLQKEVKKQFTLEQIEIT